MTVTLIYYLIVSCASVATLLLGVLAYLMRVSYQLGQAKKEVANIPTLASSIAVLAKELHDHQVDTAGDVVRMENLARSIDRLASVNEKLSSQLDREREDISNLTATMNTRPCLISGACPTTPKRPTRQ